MISEEISIKRRISNVMEYLNISKGKKIDKILTSKGKKSRKEVEEHIRILLNIDKQCFQCLEYKFRFDISFVEDIGQNVCSDCVEKIIGGRQIYQEK